MCDLSPYLVKHGVEIRHWVVRHASERGPKLFCVSLERLLNAQRPQRRRQILRAEAQLETRQRQRYLPFPSVSHQLLELACGSYGPSRRSGIEPVEPQRPLWSPQGTEQITASTRCQIPPFCT